MPYLKTQLGLMIAHMDGLDQLRLLSDYGEVCTNEHLGYLMGIVVRLKEGET